MADAAPSEFIAPLRARLGGPALRAARALLGMELVHSSCPFGEPGVTTAGIIVEVEAYAMTDPASHTYRGRTARNAVMFGEPGLVYIYRSYGLHWCLNIVCGPREVGAAVLLRALQPTAGVAPMRQRRGGQAADAHLARGPGCLTRALGLGPQHYGLDALSPSSCLHLRPGLRRRPAIVASPRIGIRVATERLWRLAFAGHPSVSRGSSSPTASPRS